MNTFIKLKRKDGTLMLIDLSIVEGFYQETVKHDRCLVFYKRKDTAENRPQEFYELVHSVTEIANAICGQTSAQDCTVVDLTMDKLGEESDTEKPNTDYDREASEI